MKQMKKVVFLLLLLTAMITIVACSSDDESNNTTKTVNDGDKNEKSKGEDEDQAKNNDGYKELGESGYATDTLGDIEFTPTKVEVFKERDGETTWNDDEVFVLIDFTLENVGDRTYGEGSISSGTVLLVENEGKERKAWEDAYYEYEFVDSLKNDVEPGETVTGQLIFMPPVSDTSEYILELSSTFDDTEDSKWILTGSEE